MIIKLVSYNGHNINDGTNYRAVLPAGSPLQPAVSADYVERADNWPVYAGKTFRKGNKFEIEIAMLGNYGSQLNILNGWFDVEDNTPRTLAIQDESNGNKAWKIECVCVGVPELAGNVVTVVLESADGKWTAVTEDSTSWSITATGQTKEVPVGGNAPARPIIEFTPTGGAGGGYAYRKYIQVNNPIDKGYVDWGLMVTLDTAALVSGGKCQADGDDLRLIVDGIEANRWLADMNTDHTKVHWVATYGPRIEFTLGTAIASSGTIGEIQAVKNTANLKKLILLPKQGLVLIGSEIFTYSGVDLKTYKVGVVNRAQRTTSMAAHSSGDTVKWLEHDIWLMYGDSTLSAPVTDDTKKPIYDLISSTMDSLVYTSFADSAGLRAGSWKKAVISSSGKLSKTYTGNQGDEADPATEMGMEMNAWQLKAIWKGETAVIEWRGLFPAGVTEVSSSGEKRRDSTSWPSLAALQRSLDGKSWATEWNETTPVSEDTWTAWTHAAEAISFGPMYVRFVLSGSILGSANNQVRMEVEAVTVVMTSANVLQISLLTEAATYWMDARFTNVESGEYFEISYPMTVNRKLTIDCAAKRVLYIDTDVLAMPRLSSMRKDWLNLLPGMDNTVQYDAASTGAATVVIKRRDRSS
jgi:hypothetical protein